MNRKFSKLEKLPNEEAFPFILRLLDEIDELLDGYLSPEEVYSLKRDVDYIKNQTPLRRLYENYKINYCSKLN